MPFTLAHAAAAFPLRRFGLVFSALILGTFAPDLEYFLRLAPDDGYGHTLNGLFLLTLPLALITLWLFHVVVKRPLIGLLPSGIARRLAIHADEFSFRGPVHFGLIVLSILVGAATHLAWDSLTHKNTWPYRNWDILREGVTLPFLGSLPIYKILQHGSTVLGIGVLSVWVILWYRKSQPSPEAAFQTLSQARKIGIVISATTLALVGAVVRAIVMVGFSPSNLIGKRTAGLIVVTAISLLWWQCVLYGVWWQKFRPSES